MSYKLLRQIVSAEKTNHPQKPLKSIEYLTIHNTDTYSTGATAQASANYLGNNSQGSQASWHYTVDDTQAIQSFEDSQECWHAGDGTNGAGNSTSIAIEISTNWGFTAKGQTVSGINTWDQATVAEMTAAEVKFRKACDNAAQLTADLMKAHGLSIDKVVQHNYWKSSKYPSGKNCPYALRQGLFGTSWDWFTGLVTKYYNGSTTPVTENKEETDMSIKVGDTVKITGAKATYTNGKTVPDSVKNKAMTVQQINDDKLLIKEIVSWVYAKDCIAVTINSLASAATTNAAVTEAQYDAVTREKIALNNQIAALTSERNIYMDKLAKSKILAEQINKL